MLIGVCLLSPLDISIRHFSVPLVWLVLLLAPTPRLLLNCSGGACPSRHGSAAAVAAPAAGCFFTAAHAYPYYFPYINALSLGRPAYALVNDSNVDWNQSLPEVKRFAEQHGLGKIDLGEFGFLDPAVWVPQAQLWNCHTATDEHGRQGVTLSAILILDGHNCAGWTATAVGISRNWRDTGC